MKRIHGRTLAGVVVAVAVLAVAFALAAERVKAQDHVVSEVAARLAEQGVPLKGIRISSRIPFRVEALIQSESRGQDVAPRDPLFTHAVEREVALARQRYRVGIELVKVVIVNAQGEPIFWSDIPTKSLPDDVGLPGSLRDAEVVELVRGELNLSGLQLQELTVSTDADGARVLSLRLPASAIEDANESMPRFSPRGQLGAPCGQAQCRARRSHRDLPAGYRRWRRSAARQIRQRHRVGPGELVAGAQRD